MWLAATRFYLVGMGASLMLVFIVVGGWTVREMTREVTARGQPSAEGRATQRSLGETRVAPADAVAQAERREKCLSDNLVAGLSAASSQVIARACEEIARGDDDAGTWACVINMRSTLLNAPNPTAVLRACGAR